MNNENDEPNIELKSKTENSNPNNSDTNNSSTKDPEVAPSALEIKPTGSTPIKTSGTGTRANSIKLPSIADIKSGKFELKKEEVKVEEYHPRNEFSYGDFKHYWDEAIAQILAKNQASINVMISNINPELKNDTDIVVTFNNKVQSDLFVSEQPFLLGYLKSKLQNHDLRFIIEINTTDQDNTPYTNSEKFKAMAAKNPNLQTLRDVFGLDIS